MHTWGVLDRAGKDAHNPRINILKKFSKNMLYSGYIMLHCIILRYTVLYYVVSYYAVLYYTVLSYNMSASYALYTIHCVLLPFFLEREKVNGFKPFSKEKHI